MDLKRTVVLDRDGTINVDHGYVTTIKRFEFLPRALDALRALHERRYSVFVVSNQSAISRDMATKADVIKVMDFMHNAVRASGGRIIETVFCPHGPDSNCECRKPKTRMFTDLAARYHFDLRDAWCVGDGLRDIEAGNLAGCKTILIYPVPDVKFIQGVPYPECKIREANIVCTNLWNAVAWIIKEEKDAAIQP